MEIDWIPYEVEEGHINYGKYYEAMAEKEYSEWSDNLDE